MNHVVRFLDGYISCTEGERKDFKEHAYRVHKIVKAYTGDDLPPEAASLSLIHDVADRMFNKESTKYNDVWPGMPQVHFMGSWMMRILAMIS